MAEEIKDSKTVYNIVANNCEYVIAGDGNTIITSPKKEDDDEMTEALKVLPTLSKLPGEPFHTCLKRSHEVEKIFSLFNNMSDQNEGHLTTVYLTGPPGSGKTQLARQFGEIFGEVKSDNNEHRPVVLTINVESIKSLLKSTKELLQLLKLAKKADITKEADELKVVQLYMEKLRVLLRSYSGKWLLILDNMFADIGLNEVLPRPGCEDWGDGKAIVTSQNSDLAPAGHLYAKTYPLNHGLEETDAVNVLQDISGLQVDQYAVCLAKELGCFPLSLACAATYVKQMNTDRPSSNFSWKQFLELHRKHKGNLKFRTFKASNVYPDSMAAAARLATSRLAEYSNVLRHAFDFLSYCNISPVPLVIVSNFVHASISSDTIIDDIMAEISRCSLLVNADSSFEGVESIKFHQVMGEAFEHVREERASTQKLDAEQRQNDYVLLLHSLQESLDKGIPDYDRSNVALKMLISPHLKSIINFGKAQKWTDCAEFVVILAFLADCLYHVSSVTEAERISYSELAYEIAKRLPEPLKSLRYCQVLKTLGFYYREDDCLEKSVVVLKEGLRLTDGEDGEEWMALKSALLHVLSWTYKLLMKLDLAEDTMKESIKLAKTAFGQNHQEIVARLCNLAIIYREQQDISKAKETVDEARQMAETSTDEWNLTRAQAANFSAKIYLRYAEMTENSEKKIQLLTDSLKLHSDALVIYENVLGESHIYVAGVCMTYAMAQKELNNRDHALELTERAEKIYRDVKHTQLSSALRHKTEVLLALDNASEAEKAIKESIELSNCGRARFLLSEVYLQQKRYPESRSTIKEVLGRWKSGVLPPTHFWVKRAEKIKQQCDRELFKVYFYRLVPVIVLIVSIFLVIWYNS